MRRPTLLFLAIIFAAPSAFAWGEKGHLLVAEAATLGLPNDMPPFFYRAYPDLIWLAYDPDRWKGGGASSDAANEPDHFIDYEFTTGLDLPPSRYQFIALMATSGRLQRYGLRNDETGFLPWRIAELSQRLTTLFRLWRFAHPNDRPIIERDIIHTAGILGHFAGDSSQPLHATSLYNGWTDPNPNQYANDCEIHARFESNFVSHSISLSDVTPKMSAPASTGLDYFAAALDHIRASNAQVETLYRLDRDGAFDVMHAPPAQGVAFVTDRMAFGASFLRDLWWSAWRNSEQKRARRAR